MSQQNIVANESLRVQLLSDTDQRQPTNNAVNTVTQAFNTDQGDAKVDYNITEKDRFDGRYSQAYQNDPQTTPS